MEFVGFGSVCMCLVQSKLLITCYYFSPKTAVSHPSAQALLSPGCEFNSLGHLRIPNDSHLHQPPQEVSNRGFMNAETHRKGCRRLET